MTRNVGKTCAFIVTIYTAVWVKLLFYPWTLPVKTFLALPVVLLATVALYAAFTVIKGVITFNRSQNALDDLMKELKMAQVALKRAGFDFDKFKIPTQ